MIKILKSKLQEVVVTEASLEYDGSITIDEDLMDAAGFKEYEYVEVNGKTTDARINTYVLKGKRGSGCIKMNGGAARHFKVGDHVHVLAFEYTNYSDVGTTIVKTDESNKWIK